MHRRNFLRLFAGASIAALGSRNSNAALMPPYFMFCVVALGGPVPEIRDNSLVGYKWSTVGTGFFYGHLTKAEVDPLRRQYKVYLVTAKHVVDGWNTLQATMQSRGLNPSELMIRVNPVSVMSQPIDISLSDVRDTGSPDWIDNPDGKDISVLAVNIDRLQPQFNVAYFPDDVVAADRQKLKDLSVSAGDGVFVLGFPMGLTGNTHSAVVVREGIIARIEDLLYFGGESFLIDSFVFPGNSGGPVLLKPELISIPGTQNHPASYLIGVVDAYQPYREPAVSPQTQETRVIFEENSGLAAILPIDYVIDTIIADSIVSDSVRRRS